jgi:glycosyltransferase involved in cell wall biosynthesis
VRILIISDVSGYMRGGVPAETGQLIRGLVARGHELALAGDVPMPGGESARHFPVTVPTDAQLPSQVRRAIDAFEPELIHVIAMGSRGLSQIAPELKPHPWVMTCHSIPPYERKLPHWHGNETAHYAARSLRFLPNTIAWKWLFRSRTMPQVVVHSDCVRQVVTRYGFPAERISLIPLGYDATNAPRHDGIRTAFPDGPRLVTTGGIAHTKGYHDAIAAVAQLRPEFPDLRYQIIGEVRDASYIAHLQALAQRLGVADCVQITPDLPHEDKERALQGADVYLQPSHEEGFCLAYIEAAAVVPRLVGADTGAIGLISADDPGARVVPVRQPSSLAGAVRELLQSPLPADLMASRATRLCQRFAWSTYLDRHEQLHARLAIR